MRRSHAYMLATIALMTPHLETWVALGLAAACAAAAVAIYAGEPK